MTSPDGSGGPPAARGAQPHPCRAEVYLAVRSREEGLENLELPSEWAEVLAAADEWREKMLAVPIKELARWVRANRRAIERGAEAEIDALASRYLGPYGIDEGLLERVVGPDRAVLSSEERAWLIHAPLADDMCSEWAWRVGSK